MDRRGRLRFPGRDFQAPAPPAPTARRGLVVVPLGRRTRSSGRGDERPRHNHPMRSPLLSTFVLLPVLSGCVVAIGNKGSSERDSGETVRASAVAESTPDPHRSALIHHVVLIRLNDPADLAAFTADCDRLLPSIPGVEQYWRGTHLDTGRAIVIGDYSLMLHVAFADRETYRAYLAHPSHVELGDRWRPKATMLIYDAWDPG